jgi:predicted NUDIX family NTP pyrophosphohydrolase
MGKKSAAILLFRRTGEELEVLLVHPGGPFWAKKDDGAWSLPKGEFGEGEDPLTAARREFEEELGAPAPPTGIPLQPRRQKGGKTVYAWAAPGDFDPAKLSSNRFSMEWPPRSGRHQEFPEVDRAAWFTLPAARAKILAGQQGFLDELAERWAADPTLGHP